MPFLSPDRHQPLCCWEEGHGEAADGLRWPSLGLLPSTAPHCGARQRPGLRGIWRSGDMLNAHPAVSQTWPLTRTVLIGQCRKRASYSRFIPLGQRSEKSHHIPECLQYKPCWGGGVITRNCNKHWSISSVPGPMAKCHWGLGQPVSKGRWQNEVTMLR